MEYIFLLGRILLGGYFLMNAYNHFKNHAGLTGYAQSKGVPMPKVAVLVTGLMLLLGGAGILFGVWLQFAILLLSIFLIGTTFKMHQYWKISDPMQRMGERINFYKNLGLLGSILILVAVPAAAWVPPWMIPSHCIYTDFLFVCI